VDGGLGATVDQRCNGSEPLMCGSVEDVRIARIHDDFVDTRVLAAAKDLLPALTAIDGLVEATLATARPQRALRSHVDDLRISWIDQDGTDVLGVLQAHVLPGLTAIETSVDAIAVADVSAADVLAGTDPDGIRIVRIERQTTDGVRLLAVENGFPGRARVLGLPDSSTTDRDVPRGGLVGMKRHVGDATRHQGRPDAPQLEPGKGLGLQNGAILLFGPLGHGAERCYQRDRDDDP